MVVVVTVVGVEVVFPIVVFVIVNPVVGFAMDKALDLIIWVVILLLVDVDVVGTMQRSTSF